MSEKPHDRSSCIILYLGKQCRTSLRHLPNTESMASGRKWKCRRRQSRPDHVNSSSIEVAGNGILEFLHLLARYCTTSSYVVQTLESDSHDHHAQEQQQTEKQQLKL
jgi:hypothetical protein